MFNKILLISGVALMVGASFLLLSAEVALPVRAATDVVLSAMGTQVDTMLIPSSDQYVSGGFRMMTSGDTTITSITLKEKGNSSSSDMSNIRLYYDIDTTAPYDCASEVYSQSDSTFGFATSFSSSRVTYTGSMAIGGSKSACLYLVLDVNNTAGNGETLEIAMSPGAQIASGDFAVVSSDPLKPSADEEITGTTVFVVPPPAVVSVSAIGSQIATAVSPSESQYIGGAFKMLPDTGSAIIKQVTLRERGSINAPIHTSQIRLFYDLDTTAPYDCASEIYDGDEPELGSASSFNSVSRVTFLGSATVTTTQAGCFYPVLDIESSAKDGDSIEFTVDNPSNDVVVEVGATVLGSSEVALSGTTLIEASPESGVTVSSFGAQVAQLAYPSVNQHLGGTFRVTAQGSAPQITKIRLGFSGTFSASNIDTAGLFYDLDTIAPYDCTSDSFDGDELQYGVSVDPGSAKYAVFTGIVEVNTGQAMCIYPVVSMLDGDDGDTIEVELSKPGRNMVASGGAAVIPNSDVEIIGTTVISATAIPTIPNVVVNDGDLIRAVGDHRVYIVRIVGSKKFIRHIIDSAIFDFYGHFNFAAVKDVVSLDGYTLSAWIRLPLAVGDTESEKVYEINDDAGPGGSKHWITCATPTTCESTWRSRGGDPDGVYTINVTEMNYYITSSNVFLQ